MSTYYNTHGVSARPRKKGGGLGSILGTLLGTGVSTGGTFNPAVDADAAAREEFASRGVDPTDEDASIDAWNEVRNAQIANGVTSKPASYEPYQLKNPILTQIFNPQLASQLESRNFAANQMMYSQQLHQEAAKQEYERRLALAQFEQGAQSDRSVEQARMQREHAQMVHDLSQQGADADVNRSVLKGIGAPAGTDISGLAKPRLGFAQNQANAMEAASADEAYKQKVMQNLFAGLDAQSIANWKNSIYTAQPNEMGMRYDVNKNRVNEVLPGSQMYKTEEPVMAQTSKGITYPAGTKTSSGIRTTPGYNIDDLQAKRDALERGNTPGVGVRAMQPKVEAKPEQPAPKGNVKTKPPETEEELIQWWKLKKDLQDVPVLNSIIRNWSDVLSK